MKTFIKLQVSGLENIKDINGPVIFMPNHLTYFDPVIVMASVNKSRARSTAFAAANDVLYGDYKWFSKIAELLFLAFPFPRKEGENIKMGLDYIGQLLDGKYSVAVFPEGEISEDGKLVPLKRGAGLIAVEMGVPIVPVFIDGSNKIFPYFKLLPRSRGVVKVKFGKPIKCKPNESYLHATERIEEVLKNLSIH